MNLITHNLKLGHNINKWQDSTKNSPFNSIHQLFEQNVKINEKQTAVVYLDNKISYQLLNQKANQLAHLLIKNGVKNESMIGVYVDKSINFIVSMLAILKCGAVCVPLSPSYPIDRINGMIDDAKINLLLVNEKYQPRFDQCTGTTIFLESTNIDRQPRENPNPRVFAESLAFIFFTSGSTGKPKGVQITHGGIVNHMQWMKQKYFTMKNPIVLQKASCNFDAALWEIFLPLICDGTLVIMPEGKTNDLDFLIEVVNKERINTLELTPSSISLLLETKFFDNEYLNLIFSSSEILHTSIYNKFLQGNYKSRISVLYGPTEATIDSTSYDCLPSSYTANIPIGKPISNTQIYILDNELNQVPVGEIGEIYIGGQGLARGYLDRKITASKFVPNPFAHKNDHTIGSRLYKTGDIGRFHSDGNIEFLGRTDRQIKLRGFRIELDEIENVILSHPEIQQAFIVQKERDIEGQANIPFLIAYYKSKANVTESQLIDFLAQALPYYMIPNHFVALHTFPLNKNGKIDIHALPAINRQDLTQNYLAPQSNIEKELCLIWQDVLKTGKVGIMDNFFHLGGNSLLCISIINKIKERLGINLLPIDIYAALTIANISKIIITKQNANKITTGAGITHSTLDSLIAKHESLLNFSSKDKIVKTKYGAIWTQLVFINECLDNAPIIFLHGGPSGSHDALRQLIPLCKERPLLFFDQLGGGRSDTPIPSHIAEFDIFVESIDAIVEAYNLDLYYLFGDCLSCTVIIKFVATHGNKPKGIILSSPSVSEELHDADLYETSKRMPKEYQDIIDYHRVNNIYNSAELTEARNKFDDMFVLEWNKFTNYLTKSYLYIDPEFCERMAGNKGMFFPTEGSLQGIDVSNLLEKINVPTLITFGENDFVTPKHRKLFEAIKSSTIITFKDCAHWPFIEKTVDYIKTLNKWLDSH